MKQELNYFFLFFLTIFLIFLILIANYNTYKNNDVNIQIIKSYPWEQRSSYIKEMELYSKLANKNYLTNNDLPRIEELISISEKIKDLRMLNYSLNLKYKFLLDQINLLTESKYINFILKNVDFKTKMGLLLLTGNTNIISTFNPEELEKANDILKFFNLEGK